MSEQSPEAEVEAPATRSFTVAVAATTITTGDRDPNTGKAEVIRLVRGDVVNADPHLDQIRVLRSMRALVPTEKFAGADTAVTTRRVYQIWQRAANEAIAVEQTAFRPIDAPQERVAAES